MRITVVILVFLTLARAENSCLVVRDVGSHRLRNGLVAGTLTLGLGAIPAATLTGGQKFKRVAAFGDVGRWKTTYSPKDLKRLDARGAQVIVLAKDAEIADPAKACGYGQPQPPMPMMYQPYQPQPMAQPMAQPQAVPTHRTCIATMISRDGTEVCTQYSPQ